MEYIKRIDWKRVARTLVQVFGGVVSAFLLYYGAEGAVAVRDYVFGPGGIIVVGTTALALAMNLPTSRPE
jgi:hypothetical protein